MKVAAIMGSPRQNANSGKLVEAALKGLPQSGLEIKRVQLNALNIKGCQACFACKGKSDVCVVNDDLAPVLAYVAEADLLVLASPIYIGEVTAQMKMFIDRTFSYYLPDYFSNPQPSRLKPGKKLLFLLTQGLPDKTAYEATVLGHYERYFQGHGYEFHKFIVPGQGPRDLEEEHPEILRAVTDLAAEL